MKSSKRKKSGTPLLKTLPRELRDRLIALGEEIHSLTAARRFDEAERLCQSGLALIPKPWDAYIETTWYLSALGEIYFLRGQYLPAGEYCEKARLILENMGENDPFIMLRLGEIAFETGDENTALRYLLAAYKAEGDDVFYGQDGKYYDFLKEHINTEQKGQGL